VAILLWMAVLLFLAAALGKGGLQGGGRDFNGAGPRRAGGQGRRCFLARQGRRTWARTRAL
jgi:hypothetical protein